MLKKLFITATCALVIAACAQSPTGRRQIMLFSDTELSKMGAQTFDSMKEETPISKDAKTNSYVNCVTNNLLAVTPDNLRAQSWEIVVFDSDQVNAFALPGGKIGVYTGLLQPITVTVFKCLTHPRIASVQIRQRCQLIVKFLPRDGRVADRRRPVINIGFGLSWI